MSVIQANCHLQIFFLVLSLTNFCLACDRSDVKKSYIESFEDRLNLLEENLQIVSSDKDFEVNPRVIGGQDADFNQTRFQVSLRLKAYETTFGAGHICGGSLILSTNSTAFVLTAAHCVYYYQLYPTIGYVLRDPSEFQVVLGDVYLTQKTSNHVVVDVKQIIPHEMFCMDQLLNDIALLEISPVDTKLPGISLIPLANNPIKGGSKCIVSGWGYTNKSAGIVPEKLQAVDLRTIDFENCQVSYGTQIGPGMLCAGNNFGKKSACNGDSGGPFVCDGLLHGIVSWGSGTCSGSCSPNVYTRVTYYRDWITQNIGDNAKYLPSSKANKTSVLNLAVLVSLASVLLTVKF